MDEIVKVVDGFHIKAFLNLLGVDYKDVAYSKFEIAPPGRVEVTRLLRNEDGHFYKDDEGDVAHEVLIARIAWDSTS